jgi:two-component system CheB/CheR fusion protein
MQVSRTENLEDYYNLLRDNVDEAQALLGDLLISVTTFFRDRDAFEALAVQVIPHLFTDKQASDKIRAWVPGCATGEEAYSIAMLLLEEASRHETRATIQVFGSDLDVRALAIAREGRYPAAIEARATISACAASCATSCCSQATAC